MKKWFPLLILISFVLSTNVHYAHAGKQNEPARQQSLSEAEVKLKSLMQELWIEHTWWTRSYIVSNLAGLEDQTNVLGRLMKNQEDIGNAIKPYYGDQAGNKLTGLLKEHISIAGNII